MTNRPAPAAELVEARRVHHRAWAGIKRLARFLDDRCAARKGEVAGNAAVIVVQHDAGAQHRLLNLDAKGADLHVGAFGRGATRAIEAMLASIARHDTEGAIENAAMRVDRHADTEIIGPVLRIAVEPCAVIDVAVAGRRMGDRFGRLMDRVIVELVEHCRAFAFHRTNSTVGPSLFRCGLFIRRSSQFFRKRRASPCPPWLT